MLCAFGSTISIDCELYYCDLTNYLGIYKMPELRDCKLQKHEHQPLTSKVIVYQFHEHLTPIKLYLCSAQKIVLTCDENIFGKKHKYTLINEIKVTESKCRKTVTTGTIEFGSLKTMCEYIRRGQTSDLNC